MLIIHLKRFSELMSEDREFNQYFFADMYLAPQAYILHEEDYRFKSWYLQYTYLKLWVAIAIQDQYYWIR